MTERCYEAGCTLPSECSLYVRVGNVSSTVAVLFCHAHVVKHVEATCGWAKSVHVVPHTPIDDPEGDWDE